MDITPHPMTNSDEDKAGAESEVSRRESRMSNSVQYLQDDEENEL